MGSTFIALMSFSGWLVSTIIDTEGKVDTRYGQLCDIGNVTQAWCSALCAPLLSSGCASK